MSPKSPPTFPSVLPYIFISIIFFTTSVIADATLQIDHVLKGRAFGSTNSTEISRRIVIDDDGALYIAGTTKPEDNQQDPWGDTEPGDKTGKTDLFVAKISPTGDLLWVRRTGSQEDDTLGDMKIFNNALYLCGSTGGDLGHRINGSSDAFVTKINLNGDWAWRQPFQFGSAGEDACHALTVGKAVYVAGSTSGIMFGGIKPAAGSVHHFIAKLDEDDDLPSGLRLARGRQRNAYSSSSANSIGISLNKVIFLSMNWDVSVGSKERVTTYVNFADEETVLLHRLHILKTDDVGSFRGLDLFVVNETGHVYVVGISSLGDNRDGYYAMKFNPDLQGNLGGIEWSTFLGYRSNDAPLDLQQPSIAVDPSRGNVYVTGTEDGIFDNGDVYSGIVLVPFFKLDMDTGNLIEKWDRSTNLANGKQEILDIAINGDGDVFFTGVSSTPRSNSNALVGSFGSPLFSSHSEDVEAIGSSAELNEDPQELFRSQVHASDKGWIIWGCAVSFISLIAIYACCLRRRRQECRPGFVLQEDVWQEGGQVYEPIPSKPVYQMSSTNRTWGGRESAIPM